MVKNHIIPIVYATDDFFVPYCGVSILSLIRNADSAKQYKVYVLYSELSISSIYRLERLSCNNVAVQCVCIQKYVKDLSVVEHNHLTIATIYRLLIPTVLPEYEKVVYIDSDTIVLADVSNLYAIDIGDNYLAAVHGFYWHDENDAIYRHVVNDLKLDIEDFFNAGILVMNNLMFKKEAVSEHCLDLLTSRNDLTYMDQCALNIVCRGRVKFLDSRWNFEWLYLFPASKLGVISSEAELVRCEQPFIVHYDGADKPWNNPSSYLSDYFWQYARISPFYEEIMLNSQATQSKMLLKSLGLFPKGLKLAVYGAGNAGWRYVRKISSLKWCEIAIWVDQNYKAKQDMMLPIKSVDELFVCEFDYVIITIENPYVSNSVKNMLIKHDISADRIIQICKD